MLNVENFELNVYDLEDTDNRLGSITLEKFKQGCQICAKDYPNVWNNLITESSDANDADILFQLACMGEVVFG